MQVSEDNKIVGINKSFDCAMGHILSGDEIAYGQTNNRYTVIVINALDLTDEMVKHVKKIIARIDKQNGDKKEL